VVEEAQDSNQGWGLMLRSTRDDAVGARGWGTSRGTLQSCWAGLSREDMGQEGA
jgi:hypothetical protein